MSRRATTILFVGTLVATACAQAAADDDAAPGTASSVAAPATAGSSETTSPVASATSQPPATEPAGTEPVDLVRTDVATTVAVVTLPATASTTTEPSASSPAPDLLPIEDEAAADEPTFELEPFQPLDLDAVRFAVDDAGIGGTIPADTGPPPTGWAGFDAALGSELLRNGNTSASVAVSIGGDVVHAAAFGSRTLDGRDPAEPGDRYRIASISKTITAITLLQLVESGVVGLDEPVGALAADHLGIDDPSAGAREVTVRRLLNHTSGFGKYDGVFFRGRSADCRDAATIGLRSGVGGGSYRYSNMNYCVAGFVIEALTGRPYEAVVYEQLLTPLGLSGLRLAPTFDPGPDEVQHYSTGGRNYMETLAAAGSWLASPGDLVTILDSLDVTTPGWKPLEFGTLLQMRTPPGGRFDQRGYGLGLILYGPGRYGHTGTIESTHAMVMNRGDGVIWAVTVAGPYPDSTPRLESIVNRAFEAGGFIAG